jgi:hypothetical protein
MFLVTGYRSQRKCGSVVEPGQRIRIRQAAEWRTAIISEICFSRSDLEGMLGGCGVRVDPAPSCSFHARTVVQRGQDLFSRMPKAP